MTSPAPCRSMERGTRSRGSGSWWRLVVWGVSCLIFSTLASAYSAAPATAPEGAVWCAYWRETPGSLVSDLTSLPSYPALPSEQVLLKQLEIPENQEGNFGTLIRGFLSAPQDGEYTFYIAGNGQCELWLSPSTAPAAIQQIASVAQWTMPRDWKATPQQQSKPIAMKGGIPCYFEVRHKNGGGDNHLAVAWRLPSGELEAPIGTAHLAPATAAVVPPPTVQVSNLPTAPGRHRITAEVEYRREKLSLPILLTLPGGPAPEPGHAGLVFLPDTDQEADSQGYYLQGPDRAERSLPAETPFVCMSFQLPEGRSFDQRMMRQAMAAAIRELGTALRLDSRRMALSGSGAGGTAAWKLACEMPGFFRTVAPICAMESTEVQLAPALQGARVRIYTDVREGFATECANRMKSRLAGLKPGAEVIYLGEKECGVGTAADYCYSAPAFYARLFADERPGPAAAPAASRWRYLKAGVPLALLVAYFLWRKRKRG